MLRKIAIAAALLTGATAQTTAPDWGQCGGIGWTGPTTCPSGWVCTANGEYYSQCLQGTASSPTSPPTSTTSATSTSGGVTSSIPSGTATAGPTGATLLTNNLWVRADEEPNFHTYLQSAVSGTPGPAVLGSYTIAAQFQLNNGQVEQQLADGSVLYLNVNTTTASTATYLPTYFATTQEETGTWAFQGDGLTWTAANIPRQDIGAFLACGTGVPGVYINLGAYDYMTPAGCADQTLNYYNGATAVD
ncbi:hypothetical protein M0805_001330 [Coniferiporia weirii]|nr:hypothetical protein M0805_001330 [Coniferiporia weirii]